ncbi:MAG: TIGR03619 family F420-dependent LLM class oxidoreductase [Candidatus Binatia bacterium]
MKFWQSIAFTEVDQLFEVAKICDDVGFDGVMISDHLLHFEQLQSRYPYSVDGKPPSFSAQTVWPECWSMIAALAAVTQRIRFVTNVYILPLRSPIEVAKATSSVATFCDGRVILGAGAGWMKEEFDLLGVDFHSRGKRFDECIEVLRKLWTGTMVEHHGKFFDFPRVQMCPVPRQPIPIYIGGMSTAALRRAAQLGNGWLGAGQTPEEALSTLARLDQLRSEAGRGKEPFDAIVPLKGPPEVDVLKRLQDAGVGGTVSYPFTFTIGATSTLEAKRAYLERYANTIIAKLRT